MPTHESIEKQLEESYVSSISKDLGFVVSVISVEDVGDGIIIPGDGAAFYKSRFRISTKTGNQVDFILKGYGSLKEEHIKTILKKDDINRI